jgi:glycosyltransferase involved in cell wall biosynthesis
MGNMAADSAGLQEAISKVNNQQINRLKEKYKISGTVLLFVGQIIPRKGIMELLAFWKKFESEHKEPQLVLLGDGEQFKEASDYIKENNVKNIRLLGRVDYTEVSQFYAMADIFLIPTLEDNWSLVVPEAMSCGLPIICSTYNGCWPELVKPENGWVFDPLDPGNFKTIIEAAWENKDKWGEMGKKSLEIIQDYYPEKVALKIYNTCKNIKHKT